LIIAGEKSGEEHCMSFFNELKQNCPDTSFWGVGGDEMKSHGFECLYHLNDFSSWGVSEVIGKIPFYFKAFYKILDEVKKRKTKTAILIDFQDFNLRLAKKLKKQGVNVLYYVAPQAWAWKAGRAKALEKSVHTLFTILPFEKQWFEDRGVTRVRSIAHPLLRTYKESFREIKSKKGEFFQGQKLKLLLLPGSRNFEVSELLPLFVQSVKELRQLIDIEVRVVKSPSVNPSLYDTYANEVFKFYDHDKIESALDWADMSFAASGTVTLMCSLFQVPTIICYRSSLLNEYIYFSFISYDGPIGLANIVHEDYVLPELIQEQASTYNIVEKAKHWILNKNAYVNTVEKLSRTKELVQGDNKSVPEYMAKVILEELEHV
tara:strand:+ start:9151 stop:10278 length:1128 start_codon:yes stop_codon:yes gene_type:complete